MKNITLKSEVKFSYFYPRRSDWANQNRLLLSFFNPLKFTSYEAQIKFCFPHHPNRNYNFL